MQYEKCLVILNTYAHVRVQKVQRPRLHKLLNFQMIITKTLRKALRFLTVCQVTKLKV